MSARHVELVRPLLKLIPILKFNESYKKTHKSFTSKNLVSLSHRWKNWLPRNDKLQAPCCACLTDF